MSKINLRSNAKEKSGEYYFIRSFEIMPSYLPFISTWTIAHNSIKSFPDVSQAVLLKSMKQNSELGYISFSKWASKEAFKKLNLDNPVLKNHNLTDLKGRASVNSNLYRLVSETGSWGKIRLNEMIYFAMFDNKNSIAKDLKSNWDEICSMLEGKLKYACLFKSVFKNSRFGYVGLMLPKKNGNNVYENIRISDYYGKNTGKYQMYSTLYKVVKKIKQ